VLTKKKIDENSVTVRASSRIVPTTSETARAFRGRGTPAVRRRCQRPCAMIVCLAVGYADRLTSTMAGARI